MAEEFYLDERPGNVSGQWKPGADDSWSFSWGSGSSSGTAPDPGAQWQDDEQDGTAFLRLD